MQALQHISKSVKRSGRAVLQGMLCVVLLLLTPHTFAQVVDPLDLPIRYVSTSGSYSGTGTSWGTAKSNLQNAIDEVYAIIKDVPGMVGYVFVAGSTGDGMRFEPTRRSTGDVEGTAFNTSFLIYERVRVFGGFNGETLDPGEGPEKLPGKRIMDNVAIIGDLVDKTYAEVEDDIDKDNIGGTVRRWNFKYKTVLTGSHTASGYQFIFNPDRGLYSTVFPMNSYHVVWFATNGKITPDPSGPEKELVGHFYGLADTAIVDGVTIEGGFASSTNLNGHEHTGYGGGVYMVNKAMLRNCIVHNCAAMQRGGGVYMDGGGTVERCYIHTCQATGYGMQQGYGGGVCIDYNGAVEHSYIIQCAARIGAGLAICHVPGEYPEETAFPTGSELESMRANQYTPFSMSTLIANCTSNAEGAGVYLDEGGTLNHCSVVNNKCIGPNVIYYGRRHGRTGGVYVRDAGTIYNSVLWGNECPANNSVQLAAFQSEESSTEKRITVHHTALSKSDITDWAAITKSAVVSLKDHNYPEQTDHAGNFPMFKQPTANAGVQYNTTHASSSDPPIGAVDPTQTDPGQPYQRVYNWHPLALSDLRAKAVQITNASQVTAKEVYHAHTDVDVVGRKFESISSCGALARSYRTIQFAKLAPLEVTEGRVDSGDEPATIPTLFVDPNLDVAGSSNDGDFTGYDDEQPIGYSWQHPMKKLADAVYFFKSQQKDGNYTESDYSTTPEKTYFYLGEKDEEGNEIHYRYVQILVKQGESNVAGRGAYISGEARTAAIRPVSNMRLYGGFSEESTSTDVSKRNPRDNVSYLSANVLDGKFENNSVHVVSIANSHHVIVDGFRLLGGNANIAPAPSEGQSQEDYDLYYSMANGGGLAINNANEPDADRRDMVGHILRNCVIANCAAPEGAGVYVYGGATNIHNANQLCKVELSIVNTVIRNCTADDIYGNPDRFLSKTKEQLDAGEKNEYSWRGIVTSCGNSTIYLRNCDLVNNCGFPLLVDTVFYDGIRTNRSPSNVKARGKLKIYNSLVFSNGLQVRSDRSGISSSVFCSRESYDQVWAYNVFMGHDVLLPNFDSPANVTGLHDGCKRVLTFLKEEDGTEVRHKYDDGARGGIDPSRPECDPVTVHLPRFVNPSRNVGHSTTDDQSFYGGPISYEPLATNPIVNAGHESYDNGAGYSEHMEYSVTRDMLLGTRDRGGDPDVGAIESKALPPNGSVLYVTPNGSGRRDGSSWKNAIQGNAVYLVETKSDGTAIDGPPLDGSDILDDINGTKRVISKVGDASTSGSAVLTTDSRYCGGYGTLAGSRTVNCTTTNQTINVTRQYRNADGESIGKDDTYDVENVPGTPVEDPVSSSVGGWDTRYPYGEISGQSRAFFRSKGNYCAINELGQILDEDGNELTSSEASLNRSTVINGKTTNSGKIIKGISITNDRTEKFVSGLQWAVEKAAADNVDIYEAAIAGKSEEEIAEMPKPDYVQVWVGNGTYTDYKGYVMRDKVAVYGGFPVDKTRTPGLSERQALMADPSSSVDIPRSTTAAEKDLSPADYETILQISETSPFDGSRNFNDAAIKYDDKNFIKQTNTNTIITDVYNRTDVVTMNWVPATTTKTDITTSKVNNPTLSVSPSDKGSQVKDVDVHNDVSVSDWTEENIPTGDNLDRTKENNAYWIRPSNSTDVGTRQQLKDYKIYQTISGLNGYYLVEANVWGNDKPGSNNPIPADNSGIHFFVQVGDGEKMTVDVNNKSTAKKSIDNIHVPSGQTLTIGVYVDGESPVAFSLHFGQVKLYYRGDGSEGEWSEGVTTPGTPVKDVEHSGVETSGPTTITYSVYDSNPSLRKRVLYMPDVTMPNWSPGRLGATSNDVTNNVSNDGNELVAHTYRETGHMAYDPSKSAPIADESGNLKHYTNVHWDGFSIRHGFIHNYGMCHGGGAGVTMYDGSTLENCVIYDNFNHGNRRAKGGGVFCDGKDAVINNCFILQNKVFGTSVKKQTYGGAMFMYEGTCFNTIVGNNVSNGKGGGVGLCIGRFYNNTVAYNTCYISGETNGGGMSFATQNTTPNLFMANTIFFGNNGLALEGTGNVDPFINCYIQSQSTIDVDGNFGTAIYGNDATHFGLNNQIYNGEDPDEDNTPFVADIDGGTYTGNAATTNNFALYSNNQYCINKGTTDFEGAVETVLAKRDYSGKEWDELTPAQQTAVHNSNLYKNVEGVTLPETDVAYADRVQDCQIDMGAYEYDGTRDIKPRLLPDTKQAIFYTTKTGQNKATAENPANAACYLKFQKVLDAAGRWRYASYFYANTDDSQKGDVDYHYNWTNYGIDELTEEINEAGITESAAVTAELGRLKDYEVIIRLEGIEDNETKSQFAYIPTRSANTGAEDLNDLEMSLIVPHGVRIEGGYDADFELGQDRDVLGRPTIFSGEVENKEQGTVGNVYHVVTFTNDLFDVKEKLYQLDSEHQVYDQLEFLSDTTLVGPTAIISRTVDKMLWENYTDDDWAKWKEKYDAITKDYKDMTAEELAAAKEVIFDDLSEKELKALDRSIIENNRAVLDGIFIQDGNANGSNTEHQIGAGAVVTDYAHIRNCVVRDNVATHNGGGLYLMPRALVSGSIIKDNNGEHGGGIYVEEPDEVNSETYARVITSTLVGNVALENGGGLWYQSNLRANSCAFWQNSASENGNVSGSASNSAVQIVENYPLNYCGVGSYRWAGVNNIEIPTEASEGARWDPTDWHEVWESRKATGGSETVAGDLYYYPITTSSILGRSGMTYKAYRDMRALYPTLELQDIAGLNRMAQELDGEGNNYKITYIGPHEVDLEEKDNQFIEMGARVLNGTFELKMVYQHVMTRLYVTTTEQLPTDQALTLQNNTLTAQYYSDYGETYPATEPTSSDPGYEAFMTKKNASEKKVEMYKQLGSCALNPFHRLGDALEYIINVRKNTTTMYDETRSIADYYKDIRFEVFLSDGTFYPFRDAHGKQGEARANTFVVPEEVSIIGGVDFDGHPYCQETSGTMTVAGLELMPATTSDIRSTREHMDRNGNHVEEPWEMRKQTILSGNAVNVSSGTNVYHVITCLADREQVGELPTRSPKNGTTPLDPVLPLEKATSTGARLRSIEAESSESRDKRAIILDGLTITGGYANKIEENDNIDNFQTLTYFRGGGIFIDGNWDNTFNTSTDLPEVLSVARRDIVMITADCLFQDNLAGNGGGVYTNGTFYSFSCHYTKNTAMGPETDIDRRYIPWSAGGAIANNYNVHLWNCLFDNNESKHSKYDIIDGDAVMRREGDKDIKNPIYGAEARHGYAGVVSCSETGLVRMSNCHVVRNKAVAFPAIYNFIDNNLRAYASTLADQAADKIAEIDQLNDDIAAMDESAAKEAKIAERDAAEEYLEDHIYTDEGKDRGYYGAGHHFAVNTILWGNVATGSTIALSTPIEDRYYDGIYGDGWKETQDYRQPNHVANFAPHLDIATLTFCAYQEETGRPGTVWESNQNNARQADIKNDYDPVTGEMTRDGLTRLYAGDFMSTLDEYFGYYPGTPDGDAYPYGHPETPFCKKVDGKYVPSALTDVENLIWLNTHLENEAEREVKVYGTGGYLDQHGHPYTKEDITSAAITAAVADGTYTPEEAASLTDDQKDVLFLTYVMGLLNAVPYNYNLTLSKDNNATGGPYFVQPSITAGAEGYMETADWLVGRLNNIIDTGWGFLKQNVKQQSEESGIFDTKLLEIAQSYNSETEEFTSVQDDEGNDILIPSGYKLVINNYSENVGDADYGKPWMYYERFYLDTTSVGPPVVTTGEVDYTRPGKVYLLIPIGTELETTTIEGKVRPVFESEWLGRYKGEDDNKHSWRKRVPSTTTLANDPYSELCQYTQLYGTGFYNLHAKNIHLRFEQYGYPNLLPIGDDIYMEYVHDGEGAATNMRRISTHPKMGVQDVFIDMGIYEYQYVQLVTSGKETDVIWVAEEEDETYRPCDGSTWQKATSDLQGAIETLLLSRNDHDKVIKIRGGLYSPTRITQNNEKAFFISVPSKNDGVTLPKELDADVTHMVKSLTIRGGYTNTLLDNVSDGELSRDPENPSNKVTFEMVNLGNKDEQLEHLFVIEDAEQKGTYVNYLTNDNKDYKNYVIPIVLDGITFYNPHSHGNGAALYYKEQFKTAEDGESSTTDLLEPKSYTISETRHDLPKLIVKNCTFVGNGANKDVSAVKIEKGGGHTLFVNCVFHSNQGTPLDAVNTKVINCTSALNGGHIILTDEQEVYPKPEKWKEGDPIPSANYPSGIYNSIIWRDDQVNDERIPLTRQEFNGEYDGSEKIYDPKADMPMKYNAISYNENNPTKDEPDAADDLFIDNVTGVIVDNHLLSKENGSVLYGPNFVEPDNVSILERNFHLNPSARILNQGDVATYLALVPYYPEQRTQLEKITVKDIEDRSKDEISYFHSVQRHDVPEQVTYKVGDVDNYVTYNPMTLQEANLRGTQTSTGFDALLTDATHYPFTWGIEGVDEKLPSELVSTRENNRFTAFDFTERESAFKARLYGSGLERGAYECTATIQRVVYVADGVEGEEDGTSWSDAYDIDDLQKAVDVASIYSLTSTTPSRAYVFVKESEFENNALKVRDGVSVFGSISTSLLAEVVKVGNEHTDREIEIFINRVRANRGGIAAKTTTPNIIKGLVSDNSVTFTNGFLLDGFRIEGADKTIDMTKTNTVIRNSVITDNEIAKDGDPVVNVGNGLLYNTLIYGNTPGSGASMVNVGANGYVLNTSIVGTSTVSVDDGVTKAAHVKNTIEATANDNMFAQYMRPVGGREPRPLYLTNHEPYWYQLHEESNQIDAGTVQSESDVMSMLPEGLRSYVDFTLDRDVLGNPRMINSSVDNGCFETWRVSSNRYATNETDKDARPDPGEVVLDPTADGYDADAAAAYYAGSDYVAYSNSYKSNYGGHRYPHPGSVVYVMDGGALSVNKDNFTGSNAIRPGYVLVKKGGSIYGQGNNLQFQYVAAEKVYSDQQYDMVSLPFIYNPADAIEVQSHNAETDELPFTWAPAFTKYTYDATKRAEHNHQFKENDSEAWKEMADGIVPASDGWLLKFNSPIDDTPKTIRFTGWVTDAQLGSGQYAYSEGGNSKIVNLTQYDNRVGGTGTTLNFTRQEDMGWNLKGIPYLITNYPTYPVTSEVYNMQIPRVFYKMGGDGEYVKKSEAIYTAESWESPAAISFGEGFFTQTAVISKVEDLVFRAIDAPVGALAAAPARPIVLMRDQDGEGDIIRVKPDEQAPENFSFSLGRDGIKWMMSDAPYLYLLSSSNSRLSLLGAAPVGVDIPLGVSVPKDARYEDQPHYFIFSLPEPEAFEDYSHVWLIDRTFNHITNLMEGNYTTTIDAGTDNSRFILRIGGFPYENMYGHREYIVYSWHRDLHIRGLVEGDIIQVFSLSGQMVLNTTARDPEFTAQLPQAGGIYIVRVNDFSTKVRNL